MNVCALDRRARLCTVAALGLMGCSGSGSQLAAGGARWQGPGFPGGGVKGLSLSIAAGPSALDCGDPTQFTFTKGPAPGARSHLTCFYEKDTQPAASVEWIVDSTAEDDLVHVRLTLNPDFVDNTYGANCVEWPAMKGPAGMPMPVGKVAALPMAAGPMGHKAPHTFMDLVGSDHAEFKLSDAKGNLVLHFKQDYISPDKSAPSGYATLGVSGGDGRMIEGDAADLVEFSTSLDRDLNACGLASFTQDSPATDAMYTPAVGAEAWDYRVVYDVWVRAAAFGAAGFGKASVDFVHASPSKEPGPTARVNEGPCPPDWRRYCDLPAGCEISRCADKPDQFCTGDDVPPARCGDMPDQFCKDGTVPPPNAGHGAPSEPSDAPL